MLASEATAAVAGVHGPDATVVVPLVTEEANTVSHVCPAADLILCCLQLIPTGKTKSVFPIFCHWYINHTPEQVPGPEVVGQHKIEPIFLVYCLFWYIFYPIAFFSVIVLIFI